MPPVSSKPSGTLKACCSVPRFIRGLPVARRVGSKAVPKAAWQRHSDQVTFTEFGTHSWLVPHACPACRDDRSTRETMENCCGKRQRCSSDVARQQCGGRGHNQSAMYEYEKSRRMGTCSRFCLRRRSSLSVTRSGLRRRWVSASLSQEHFSPLT